VADELADIFTQLTQRISAIRLKIDLELYFFFFNSIYNMHADILATLEEYVTYDLARKLSALSQEICVISSGYITKNKYIWINNYLVTYIKNKYIIITYSTVINTTVDDYYSYYYDGTQITYIYNLDISGNSAINIYNYNNNKSMIWIYQYSDNIYKINTQYYSGDIADLWNIFMKLRKRLGYFSDKIKN
jgi:hypothetical protein